MWGDTTVGARLDLFLVLLWCWLYAALPLASHIMPACLLQVSKLLARNIRKGDACILNNYRSDHSAVGLTLRLADLPSGAAQGTAIIEPEDERIDTP